jgi:hypothetical protein
MEREGSGDWKGTAAKNPSDVSPVPDVRVRSSALDSGVMRVSLLLRCRAF